MRPPPCESNCFWCSLAMAIQVWSGQLASAGYANIRESGLFHFFLCSLLSETEGHFTWCHITLILVFVDSSTQPFMWTPSTCFCSPHHRHRHRHTRTRVTTPSKCKQIAVYFTMTQNTANHWSNVTQLACRRTSARVCATVFFKWIFHCFLFQWQSDKFCWTET